MNRRIFDWPAVNELSRNKIKRIVSKIWTAAAPILYFSTRGTAVQILKAIRVFFYFATIDLREVSQNPWLVTGVFFHKTISCHNYNKRSLYSIFQVIKRINHSSYRIFFWPWTGSRTTVPGKYVHKLQLFIFLKSSSFSYSYFWTAQASAVHIKGW